jgi:hypothetical protein
MKAMARSSPGIKCATGKKVARAQSVSTLPDELDPVKGARFTLASSETVYFLSVRMEQIHSRQ